MKILVTLPMNPDRKKYLESQVPADRTDVEFCYRQQGEYDSADVWEAEVIIGNVPPQMLRGNRNLRLLQLNSAGTDGFLEPGLLPEAVWLANASGAYGLAISEHMLGMLLALMKKLHLYRDRQREHRWVDEGSVTSIEGSTTLVIGLGDIGGEFAKKMSALGSHVLAIRRNQADKPAYVDQLYQMDALEKLLPQADIVALTLPGTPETQHVICREHLALMKKGAFLLNVGRGTAVDTDALVEALQRGTLGGAGLDVTDPEPLPEDHPLWDLPNALITPHISGWYHLQETLERIVRISGRNLAAYFQGREPENLVDRKTGYRRFPK